MCCAVTLASGSVTAWAEDSARPRGYLHLKLRDTNSLTGVHDYYGLALGANLNRYFGIELSGDRFELFPDISGLGTIGEYGVFAIVPQVRLRYPVLGDKLVPYVLGGAGVGLTEFNDRKVPSDTQGRPVSALGRQIQDESTTPVATLGAGIEYFLADNIAIGAEFKYLFAGDQTLKVDGVRHTFNASTPLTSFGLRLFYPELQPAFLADVRDPAPTRLYMGFRAGVAYPPDSDLATGIEARPVPAAIGGRPTFSVCRSAWTSGDTSASSLPATDTRPRCGCRGSGPSANTPYTSSSPLSASAIPCCAGASYRTAWSASG